MRKAESRNLSFRMLERSLCAAKISQLFRNDNFALIFLVHSSMAHSVAPAIVFIVCACRLVCLSLSSERTTRSLSRLIAGG